MKYAKILGVLALAVGALMAFAGSASATTLTCEKNAATACTPEIITAHTEKNSEGQNHAVLHGPSGSGFTVKCTGHVGGIVTTHSAAGTVSGDITHLTFTECTEGYVVHVIKNGTLEAHTTTAGTDNGDALLTSSGTKVKVTGPVTCTYETNNTSIGWLTGSNNTGGTATFDISASIPIVAAESSIFCGTTGTWTGNYIIEKPDYLYVH